MTRHPLRQAIGRLMLAIADIAAFRMREEPLLEEIASADLPSAYTAASLTARAFRNRIDGREYLALVKEPLAGVPLVRVHSECLTGDALGSLRCDCGPQLQAALRQIGSSDGGVLIYLSGQEGRGIGLANKIRAYALQDEGLDTVDANTTLGFPVDGRDYAVAAQILKGLGVGTVRLLSNNPRKAEALRRHGIEVASEEPLVIAPNRYNAGYLAAKRDRLGHRLARATDLSAHRATGKLGV